MNEKLQMKCDTVKLVVVTEAEVEVDIVVDMIVIIVAVTAHLRDLGVGVIVGMLLIDTCIYILIIGLVGVAMQLYLVVLYLVLSYFTMFHII